MSNKVKKEKKHTIFASPWQVPSQVAYSDQVYARSSWRHIIIITSLVDSIPTDKRFDKLKGVTGADVTSLERKLQAKHRKENDKLDISTHG